MSPVRLVGGRYRVDEVIGSGAMGTVWRGYDTRLHRPVAIKEVHLNAAATDAQRAVLTRRAMSEARNAARVAHPNIVAVHDVVADRGLPCLVMRLVEGRSLAELVRSEGRLPVARVAQIGIALVDALAAAHGAGVVHRDVKPSNVLLTEDEVLLTDFSIATDQTRSTLTAGSGALGSPGYIAPERLNGEETGAPADLFGLGATLFCAVEGRGPFDRADPLAALLATATTPHPMPTRAGALGPLLDSLLSKDPADRPDLADIRAALVAVAQAPAPLAQVPAAVAPSTDPPEPLPAMDAPATGVPATGAPATDAMERTAVRPPPAHVAPRSRRRVLALVGAVVVVVCGASVLVATALRHGTHANGHSTIAAASLPASAQATAAPTPSTSGTSLPAVAASAQRSSASPSPSKSASASPRVTTSPTGSPEPVGETTSASLSVSPASYLGPCGDDITLTVRLSVTVSDGSLPIQYRYSLAPGNSDIATGTGTSADDGTFASTDSVTVHFTGGGTYAIQAVIEAPSQFSPVPATIHAVCL